MLEARSGRVTVSKMTVFGDLTLASVLVASVLLTGGCTIRPPLFDGETSRQSVCWYDNKRYSPSSDVCQDDGLIHHCEAELRWRATVEHCKLGV